MAMGTRREHQEELWIPSCAVARPASHPFYERLNELLAEHDFDRFVEGKCRPFYAVTMGRPGLPPGIYFRLLLGACPSILELRRSQRNRNGT